ncbi:UNVERIFIED_CONTAM: hypothetical protein H355_004727 [Colinus virginianus]|nr:hypothetical protein H355_004727 [Colinus virginianus]
MSLSHLHIRGQIEAADVGKIYKIRIGHDGTGIGDGWFLERVTLKRLADPDRKRKAEEEEVEEEMDVYTFVAHRWLARDEGDGELVVELVPEGETELEENTYTIRILTGSPWGAGTDANVFLTLYGLQRGDTGERPLRKSDRLNKFERGQADTFELRAIDLGELKKLRIRHDNSGSSPSWFVERVEVGDRKEGKTYYFPCQRWLAVDEDDGQVQRELVPVDEAFVKKDPENSSAREPETATLGLEQKGPPPEPLHFLFPAAEQEVESASRLFPPPFPLPSAKSTAYTVRVKTGAKKNGGTDANVFITLYGSKDDSGMVGLKSSKLHRNKFERGKLDEFTVECVDIGELRKIKIGHDNTAKSTAYTVRVKTGAKKNGGTDANVFITLYGSKDDSGMVGLKSSKLHRNKFERGKLDEFTVECVDIGELRKIKIGHDNTVVPYEVTVFTSDVLGAGTDADVFIVLYGMDGIRTSQRSLCLNQRERRNCFRRNSVNQFILEDIGDVIEKIRIGHDNRGLNSGWHLDHVTIRRLLPNGKGSETVTFPCERWLARSEEDGEVVRELAPAEVAVERLTEDGKLERTEEEVEDPLEGEEDSFINGVN